jgi:hypothetical protein
LDGDVFSIQIVFLENILVIGRPQNRVNGRAEPSPGDAEFVRCDCRPDLKQLNRQGNAKKRA